MYSISSLSTGENSLAQVRVDTPGVPCQSRQIDDDGGCLGFLGRRASSNRYFVV
jgi:hypothetical protein